MKRSNTWFALILMASALLPNVARSASDAASKHPRPNKHQESAGKETQTAKSLQPEPSVPLRNFDAAQAATLDVARALRAEQEARAKESNPQYPPLKTPANLISLGLLIVGVVYSLFAWKQWAAIKEQARISRSILSANRIAIGVARANANAAKDQALAAQAQVANLEKTLAATERSADAARDAVRIAQLALDAECPYIWIEPKSVILRNTSWSGKGGSFSALLSLFANRDVEEAKATHKDLSLCFDLNNRGRTIAIIRDVRLRIVEVPVWDWVRGIPIGRGKRRTLTSAQLFKPHPPFIESGESGECETQFCMVPIEYWREMIKARISPTIIVRAVYANTAGRSFQATQRFRLADSSLHHLARQNRRG